MHVCKCTIGAIPFLHTTLPFTSSCRGGIGKATAYVLARAGYNIAVHYHTAASVAFDLVQQLTSQPYTVKAVAFQADLPTYDGVRKLHEEVVQKMGHPDVLFNNSGVTGPRIGPQGNIQDVGVESFEQVWRTNLGTHYLVMDFEAELS